jgi:hypothetical protein
LSFRVEKVQGGDKWPFEAMLHRLATTVETSWQPS